MLISGGLLAGACTAILPLAVGVYRSEQNCGCSEGAPFCGCGLGSLAVTPAVLLAAAPTLPLLWVGAWRRGRSDVWHRFAAPPRLRALGWAMLGLGAAFGVAGAVTLSLTPSDSPGGTLLGSLLIGGAYAAGAAGGGLVSYEAGRRAGRAELKIAGGAGGLTLWF